MRARDLARAALAQHELTERPSVAQLALAEAVRQLLGTPADARAAGEHRPASAGLDEVLPPVLRAAHVWCPECGLYHAEGRHEPPGR